MALRSFFLIAVLLILNGLATTAYPTSTSTNNAGYTVDSNLKIRQLFASIKAASQDWRAFPFSNLDDGVKLRLLPVGDFVGTWDFFTAMVGPFRTQSRRPVNRHHRRTDYPELYAQLAILHRRS